MKLSHLKQIVTYIEQFKKIFALYRVDDNILKIVFDSSNEIYFDMQKSNSKIFKTDEFVRSKIYNAPFDIVLQKRLNSSQILKVELVDNDKIVRFHLRLKNSYKTVDTILQLEFTGKHTNIILLDEDMIILEALRHIDLHSSFREVRVGLKLLDLPKPTFEAKEYIIKDVEEFLYSEYKLKQDTELEIAKRQKISLLESKLKTLQDHLEVLEDEAILENDAKLYSDYGKLFASYMHTIKGYQKRVELIDFDGKNIVIEFEKELSSPRAMLEYLFTRSKKSKQKSTHIHIQKKSLIEKIEHTKLFINVIKECNSLARLNMLFFREPQSKKIKTNDSIETFFIDGYKVSLGKNERGNIYLLENAKAKDIWLHLKDMPSTHVIIKTDKQSVPDSIIKASAKLCVEFSTATKGRYLVDYTQRREVSIQSGANVLYNNYKTILIEQ